MNRISLGQLSNCTWYVMNIVVTDEKENILYDGYNSGLQSEIYKPLLNKWVKSVGFIDVKMVIRVF